MIPPLVRHPAYDAPLPEGHRFPMGKFRRLAEILEAEGLAGPGGFHRPEPAGEALLARAHAPAYVRAVLSQTLEAAAERRIGLPVTAAVAARARAAVGGTLLAARLALTHGLACNTAGGSHHADREGGAGFCVFNDVAVAALALLAEGAAARVLVVDLDVHQGDGTARIFAEDDRVFTFSMHCEANFPTRKARSDLDVALPRGAGDRAYLDALAGALPAAMATAAPDLVFYNAGVDVHAQDALGLLTLTDEGLRARDEAVLTATRRARLPTATVLGGGYAKNTDEIARRHAGLFHMAARVFAGAS